MDVNKLQECYTFSRQLRDEMSKWLAQSLRLDVTARGGGGDEVNYALAWFPHYLVTGDEKVAAHFRTLLRELANWVEKECFHGYEPEAEAHHGTEPFLLFLPRYLGLFPEDELARRLLEDAAHHIGNWVEGIPPWYDYGRDCFRSYYLGTRIVKDDPLFAYEAAEHFRFIHIALAAHRVLGDEKYLQWALRYGRQRAKRILAVGDKPIPALWDLDGRGLSESDLPPRKRVSMAGSSHHILHDPLAGIENLLASGAIYALGDLFLLSGDDLFRQAARKIVEPLVSELLDPYGDPAAAAVGYYRWTFKDDSLDEQIRTVLHHMPPEPRPSGSELAMIFPQVYRRRQPGVGKRRDMIYWGIWSDDGSAQPLREPSTATLTLAYQMTGDLDFARRAFQMAATKLMMARRVLRGGREHADMGGAVCSVAAGHGRNWGCGAVTGCYGSLLLGTRDVQSRVMPLIEVRDSDGRGRLPEAVLSLIIPPIPKNGEILFFNGGEETVTFSWRQRGDLERDWLTVTLAPKESKRFVAAAWQGRGA